MKQVDTAGGAPELRQVGNKAKRSPDAAQPFHPGGMVRCIHLHELNGQSRLREQARELAGLVRHSPRGRRQRPHQTDRRLPPRRACPVHAVGNVRRARLFAKRNP